MSALALPQSLWPVVHRLATGKSWPPENAEEVRAFLEEAKRQFLLPLLFADGDVPEVIKEALVQYRAVHRLHLARTRQLMDGFTRLTEVLDDEEMILLKGLDYGTRLYGDPALRPMSDIDVLVPAERIEAVVTRLENEGLTRSFHGPWSWRLPSAHEFVFLTETAMIEVHQAFLQAPRATIDYPALWRRRVPSAFGGDRLWRLSDEDSLAYHALSLAMDEFSARLIRYVDFVLLLRGHGNVLETSAERAREWSIKRAFFGAMTQAGRLFPEIADAHYEGVRRSLLPAALGQILERHVLPDPRRPQRASRARQLWRKFWLMDSAARRSAFIMFYTRTAIAGFLLAARHRKHPASPAGPRR